VGGRILDAAELPDYGRFPSRLIPALLTPHRSSSKCRIDVRPTMSGLKIAELRSSRRTMTSGRGGVGCRRMMGSIATCCSAKEAA
jgi:hypothetical protein